MTELLFLCFSVPFFITTDRQVRSGSARLSLIVSLLAVIAAAALFALQSDDEDSLVVYCAHDSVYSKSVLDEFTAKTGIKVAVRFDTEATKSLGLLNLIVAEKDNPRCDVFWNNLVLGTVHLQRQGLLHAYKGVGWNRIPDHYKDAEGYWAGFGGRLRVVIFNTDKLQADQVDHGLNGPLDRFAFAKPLYGTTLAHFSVMLRDSSLDELKSFRTSITDRGATMVNGNSAVKNLVANGSCDFGWTDTDDFYVAADAGKPVDILPVKTKAGQSICIPNSVSIIRGTKRLEQSKQLVDFLLSKENELRLAAKARQIPLGPVDAEELPDDVKRLVQWTENSIEYNQSLFDAHQKCLDWLSAEFLQ